MQVIENGLGKFGFTPGEVNVFDAQQSLAAKLGCGLPGEQRRKGVAQMQQAVGAWRKAQNGFNRHSMILRALLA
jgi:hypothetical protein